MKLKRVGFWLLILGGFASSPSWANLIVNGDFADYSVTSKDQAIGNVHDPGTIAGYRFLGSPNFTSNTDIEGWTITGQNGDRRNCVALATAPPYIPALAFDGATTIFDLEGEGGCSGVISQTFSTTPGDTYDLFSEYANNPDSQNTPSAEILVTSSIGELLTDSVSHSGATLSDLNWDPYSNEFIADSSNATLTFMAITDSGFSITLADISVEDVTPPAPEAPEPAPFGLVGGALIAFGLLFRRARKGSV